MSLASLSPGKARGLAATSTAGGIFEVLAVDHRDSLRVVIDSDDPQGLPASRITSVKLDLIKQIGIAASAVMLDPEYSVAQAIVSRVLPGSVGFLAAVEAQGYLGDPTARTTSLLDGWSVEKAKRVGANAVKLLVLYRPDAGAVTDAQDETITAVVADCATHDIPLFLEPLAYSAKPGVTTDSEKFAVQRRQLVIETVRRLGALGPDILKVQFPVDTRYQPDHTVWAEACSELDEASPVPWALLSGGDPYELFRDQVRVACDAGASGFLVGRALWGEYVRASTREQPHIMETIVQPRFAELSALASEYGRDWAERYDLGDPDQNWYLNY